MTARHGEAIADREDTGTFIAARIVSAEEQAADALRSHARARTPRLRRILGLVRRNAPDVTADARDKAAEDQEPGTFTGIVSEYEPEALPAEAFARPDDDGPREDEAAARIVAERAELARMFVPPEIAAIPWGLWDTPANREPMRYVPDLPADLTELPGFREALGRRTRCQAGECLCGSRIDGQTWGERMVGAGIHLYSVPASVTFAFAAASQADAAAAGTGMAA